MARRLRKGRAATFAIDDFLDRSGLPDTTIDDLLDGEDPPVEFPNRRSARAAWEQSRETVWSIWFDDGPSALAPAGAAEFDGILVSADVDRFTAQRPAEAAPIAFFMAAFKREQESREIVCQRDAERRARVLRRRGLPPSAFITPQLQEEIDNE